LSTFVLTLVAILWFVSHPAKLLLTLGIGLVAAVVLTGHYHARISVENARHSVHCAGFYSYLIDTYCDDPAF
jgi:hypothetical protein